MFLQKELWNEINPGFIQRYSEDLNYKFTIELHPDEICVIIRKLYTKSSYYGLQAVHYFDDLNPAKTFCDDYEIKNVFRK